IRAWSTGIRSLRRRHFPAAGQAVIIPPPVGSESDVTEKTFMPGYAIPQNPRPPRLNRNQVQLVANGALRLSANQKCWPEQEKMEHSLRTALSDFGCELVRAHPYKEAEKHGFIGSQREG